MRIQLILLFLFSQMAFASSDKEMAELFKNYDAVMLSHKTELVDEVFTEKFLKEAGGKKEFIAAVKELPKAVSKSLKKPSVVWKKGIKNEIYFATLKELEGENKRFNSESESQFIVVKENGKLKIDGTLSDAN